VSAGVVLAAGRMARFLWVLRENYFANCLSVAHLRVLADPESCHPDAASDQNSILNLYDAFGYQKRAQFSTGDFPPWFAITARRSCRHRQQRG